MSVLDFSNIGGISIRCIRIPDRADSEVNVVQRGLLHGDVERKDCVAFSNFNPTMDSFKRDSMCAVFRSPPFCFD